MTIKFEDGAQVVLDNVPREVGNSNDFDAWFSNRDFVTTVVNVHFCIPSRR